MRGRLQFALFLLFLPVLPYLAKTLTQSHAVVSRGCGSRPSQSQLSDPDCATPSYSKTADEFRVELLMALDLLVRAERALHSEMASYTNSVGRVPDVLGSLAQYYRVEVARATRSELLVIAVGEGRRNLITGGASLAGDRIAIDQRFRVRANFPVPQPPRDYLHTLAQSVMNHIFSNQFRIPERAQLDLWEGVFRGNFQYEVRSVSQGGRTLVAVGLNPPVQGDVIEMQPGADLYEWVYNHRNSSWIEHELQGQLERIFLAERIHQEHTGSYAATFKALIPNWGNLSSLSVDDSPLVVQEFQLDPTFGFHAEVSRRHLDSDRTPSSARTWAVNGYGQVSEVSSIERIMNQFEQARRQVTSELKDSRKLVPADRNPLLIDAVEGEH